MSELLSQLWTPELQVAFTAVIVVIVILYILSIVWVARDAYQRGTSWVWCLIALIPFLGVVAYCLLRPSLLQIDRDEQELEIALKQDDYILCPSCHTRLKNMCPTCHRALDPSWTVCPYCATSLQGAPHQRRQRRPRPQQQAPQAQQAEQAQQRQHPQQ